MLEAGRAHRSLTALGLQKSSASSARVASCWPLAQCDHAGIDTLRRSSVGAIGPLPSSKADRRRRCDIVQGRSRSTTSTWLGSMCGTAGRDRHTGPLDVCAVSLDDVRAAVSRMAKTNVDIVNLHPTRLEDIWNDIARRRRARSREVAACVTADLKSRVTEIERRAVGW